MFCGPIMALALVTQIQGGTLEGQIVDEAGRPVVGASVTLLAPQPAEAEVDKVEAQTETNAPGPVPSQLPSNGKGSGRPRQLEFIRCAALRVTRAWLSDNERLGNFAGSMCERALLAANPASMAICNTGTSTMCCSCHLLSNL
jgi:hypothetical protein